MPAANVIQVRFALAESIRSLALFVCVCAAASVYFQAMARQSSFSEEKAALICERLAGGESLLSICKDEEMPSQAAVFQWLMKHEAFQENYARARQYWAQAEFERMMEITDTPMEG